MAMVSQLLRRSRDIILGGDLQIIRALICLMRKDGNPNVWRWTSSHATDKTLLVFLLFVFVLYLYLYLCCIRFVFVFVMEILPRHW